MTFSETFPTTEPRLETRVPEGVLLMADISTRHLSRTDFLRLGRLPGFIGVHACGRMISLHAAAEAEGRSELLARGLSLELVNLLQRLAEARVYYVNFDQYGEEYSDLPTYDW